MMQLRKEFLATGPRNTAWNAQIQLLQGNEMSTLLLRKLTYTFEMKVNSILV